MTGMAIDKRPPNGSPLAPTTSDTVRAMLRGLRARCPIAAKPVCFEAMSCCGTIAHTAAPIWRPTADDAPAYFTVLVVGNSHPAIGFGERQYSPETWVHMVLWRGDLGQTVALRPIVALW